jgi:hypothetical protein
LAAPIGCRGASPASAASDKIAAKAWRIAINGLLQSSDGPLKMKPFASLKRYRWQWQACGGGRPAFGRSLF